MGPFEVLTLRLHSTCTADSYHDPVMGSDGLLIAPDRVRSSEKVVNPPEATILTF